MLLKMTIIEENTFKLATFTNIFYFTVVLLLKKKIGPIRMTEKVKISLDL